MTARTFASWFMIALLAIMSSLASAQSRRTVDYTYDEAGNIIRIESAVSQSPPSISGISPATVRIASPTIVTVSGANLSLADVAAADPGVIVRNVVSTADTITFEVTANEAAVVGPSDLTFSTALGSAGAQLSVQPRLPVIVITPSPLVIALGATSPLTVRLSNPDVFAHTLSLSVDDGSIADVSQAIVTIPALATDAPIPIAILGKQLGVTALRVTAPALDDVAAPAFVSDLFLPPPGPNDVVARAVGVLRTSAGPSPEVVVNGPFSNAVGVFKTPGPPVPVDLPLFVTGPILGAIRGGSAIEAINPAAFIRGSGPVTVAVTGTGLDSVTTVVVSPADDIAVSGFAAALDGTSATLTIDVTGQALIGERQLVLETAAGQTPALPPRADRIHIVRQAPVLTSVEPPVITLDTPSANVTIRGTDLAPVEAVAISPSAGILLGTPLASGDGTTVTVPIAVADNAALGAHVISVRTPAGVSDVTPAPRNSIAVVNGPATNVSPIAAPRLGIAKGPIITQLDPASAIIGTAVALVLRGSALDTVDSVTVVPEDGLTIGSPTPSPDGRSVSVAITIAADAPTTLRQVRAFSGTAEVLFGNAGAGRFAVTARLPAIGSTSPNFVVAGAPAVELTLLGDNLDNALSVTVLPPDGIGVSAPVSSNDGKSLKVTVSAGAGAALGNRVVVVTTPTGETPPAATAANTLAIVTAAARDVSPLVAPLVGIDKSSLGTPPTDPGVLINPHLGVTLGASASRVVPSAVPVDTSVELVILGVGLQDVSDVTIFPNDGITLDAAPIALPDGSEVRVPITVGIGAPLTLREVIVMTPLDEVRFARAAAGRLKIVAGAPAIGSIDPIQQVPGARFTLTVRGSNLDDAVNVLAQPGSGVNIGSNITVNAGGTALTVDMSVDGNAAFTDHVIRVDTPAGITTPVFGPENTFSVVTQ